MKYQKWHIGTASEQDTALLKEAGYPSLLATVLAARGITTAEAAAEALERETSLTISPMLMRDMDKAVARIQKALANDETIAVFGDYDVDGHHLHGAADGLSQKLRRQVPAPIFPGGWRTATA